MPSSLPNYLLAYRKRAALSQEDIAFLLGAHGGSKVSRYENFAREPNLETILKYEAIFGKPASQLFAGVYRKVQRNLTARVKVLIHRTKHQNQGLSTKRKLEVLTALLARLAQ